MFNYKVQKFPHTRIATIDVCEIGRRKHHVTGLIELDVTESRKKIRAFNKQNSDKISFIAWILSVIASTIREYETVASYLSGKRKRIIFKDINISMALEKEMNGQKVPIPLIIEAADEKKMEIITAQIRDAKNKPLTTNDIVLQKRTGRFEKIYYILPGFVRRGIWTYLLKHPRVVYNKMGNVAVTALGMMGRVNGWFIPISVHPVCFGIGSVVKKPMVINDKIEIREMLSLSVLLNHDVVDGAPMVRFISQLSHNVENGMNL